MKVSLVDAQLLDGYLREVRQQCWLALLGSLQLRDLLGLVEEIPPELAAREDLSRVWRLQCWQAVDTILSSGMVLSILLWPSARSQEVRVRGDQLRQALGVDEASPLKSRTVRHCIEHFDKRLDGWLVEHGGEEIDCDFVITCDDDSVPNVPLVRRMDPRTWIVRLLGDEIDLRSLLQEVNRLKAVVITDDPPTPGA